MAIGAKVVEYKLNKSIVALLPLFAQAVFFTWPIKTPGAMAWDTHLHYPQELTDVLNLKGPQKVLIVLLVLTTVVITAVESMDEKLAKETLLTLWPSPLILEQVGNMAKTFESQAKVGSDVEIDVTKPANVILTSLRTNKLSLEESNRLKTAAQTASMSQSLQEASTDVLDVLIQAEG
ncbi:hypothetical protein SPFM20_00196 [Salmonella phage SPFM20]|nr:hypothetical protein SPFM20_00196 [Salmonella phage SPFM20]